MMNEDLCEKLKKKNKEYLLKKKLKRIFQIKNGIFIIFKTLEFKKKLILKNSFKKIKRNFFYDRSYKIGQRIFIRKIQYLFKKNKSEYFHAINITS